MNKDSVKDHRPILQHHVTRLLEAAGWVIERRKRNCRRNTESVYRSPEGRPIREFPRAWRLCGQILFADKYDLVRENDGRQWTNISQFCSDLSNTLIDIEKDLDRPVTATALAHQWNLLDPFVTVVFIDRKIGVLRKGNVVEATGSLLIDKDNKSDDVLALTADSSGSELAQRCVSTRLCDSSMTTESALTVLQGNYHTHEEQLGKESILKLGQTQKGEVKSLKGVLIYMADKEGRCLIDGVNGVESSKGISGNNMSNLDLSSIPVSGSDSTCIQSGSCLYDVPVTSRNVDTMLGGSETVSTHQDSNTSSLSCDKQSSEHNVETPMRVVEDVSINSCEEKNELLEGQFTDKVGNHLQGFLLDHPSCRNDCLAESHNSEKTYVQLDLRENRAFELCRPSLVNKTNSVHMDYASRGNLDLSFRQKWTNFT
ncbi:hypothetical protein L1049_001568 [Liquidambar formosana]|uniref:Uncharacterized protein n=1 Tax=Liquidambar formosana TaxID=63359 RepID=A0AAP0R5K9_LIQFO